MKWLFLFDGVALGLGAAAPIGPVNVEIARRTLRFGRGAGFLLGCGAVTIDVIYAILTSAAGASLRAAMTHRAISAGLSIAAALFLGYLAFLCFRGGIKGHTKDALAAAPGPDTGPSQGTDPSHDAGPAPAAGPSSRAVHYATGLLMTALNPMTLIFWFIAVPGAVAARSTGGAPSLPIVSAGVFLGAFSWVCAFTSLIGHLKRFGGQAWLRWIDFAGGLLLLVFALRTIWRVAGPTL